MGHTIIAIDDHGLFCAGLELVVEQHLPGANFTAFRSIEAAAAAVKAPPDAILLDIKLEGCDGIEAVPPLRRKWPGSAFIILSSQIDEATIERAEAQGVSACISKAEEPERLVSLIREAIPSLAAADAMPTARLTARQIEIVELMREGFSNKAIAVRLGLSAFTVQAHVQAAFRALGVASRTQAVFEAQRLRLIR